MINTAAYVLGKGLSREQRTTDRFASLRPTPLCGYSEIVRAAKRAAKGDIWIALSRRVAVEALRAAVDVRKPLGVLVVLDALEPATATALAAIFKRVLFNAPQRACLPPEELADAMAAKNRTELIIAGSVDHESQTVTLWRGDGAPLIIPMAAFRPSGNGKRPDFKDFAVADYGHTLRFGSYEASVDAVLYEFDTEYRRRSKKRERQQQRGFGPSLRRLRLLKGLGRDDFQPVSAKTIARIERGEVDKPRGTTLRQIARKLGVPAEEIESF